jgi:thiamine kinase-like enzyme
MSREAELVRYLLDSGLLANSAVVDGRLRVRNTSRRHQSFLVETREGPSFFIKHGVDGERSAALAREYAIYRHLSERAAGLVAKYLPRLRIYDDDRHLLILDLVPNAESLRDYHTRRARFPKRVAARLGLSLGMLHQLTPVDGAAEAEAFRRGVPWILSVHRPHLAMLRDFSGATLQLIKFIQRVGELGERLEAMAGQWRQECLIHGDIKWDNAIITKDRLARLVLVDWEVASLGDPAWDIGSIFMDYLCFWVMSIPVTGEVPPERFAELARFGISDMQPALREFWYAYVRVRKFNAAQSAEALSRAVGLAAARLLQITFEQAQTASRLTSNLVLCLQLTLNMLRRPEAAAADLLGILPAAAR